MGFCTYCSILAAAVALISLAMLVIPLLTICHRLFSNSARLAGGGGIKPSAVRCFFAAAMMLAAWVSESSQLLADSCRQAEKLGGVCRSQTDRGSHGAHKGLTSAWALPFEICHLGIKSSRVTKEQMVRSGLIVGLLRIRDGNGC